MLAHNRVCVSAASFISIRFGHLPVKFSLIYLGNCPLLPSVHYNLVKLIGTVDISTITFADNSFLLKCLTIVFSISTLSQTHTLKHCDATLNLHLLKHTLYNYL